MAAMLAPAAALVAWTLVMLIWTAAVRFPAMAKVGIDPKAKPGGRGQNLEGVLPDHVNWKSHNYTHLLEQPTIFYAAVIIIALTGPNPIDVKLAWAYVLLRVVHSLWQAMVNTIPVRLMLFFGSTLLLIYLTYRAIMLTVFATDTGEMV